jgi:MFS family permease
MAILTRFEHEQRSAILVGLVFFMVYILSSLASRSSGSISDRFPNLSAPTNFSLALGLLCGIMSGFLFSMDLWAISVLLFIAVYMIENVRKPIGVAYLGSEAEREVLASILSVDSQLKSLVAAILAPLFGIFADLYGVGWSLILVSTGLLLVLPLVRLKPVKTGNG